MKIIIESFLQMIQAKAIVFPISSNRNVNNRIYLKRTNVVIVLFYTLKIIDLWVSNG